MLTMRALLRTLGLTAAFLLTLLAGRTVAAETLWTGTDRTPLRAERSGQAVVLKDLPRGQPVRLIRSEGAWLLVLEPGGVRGWAYQGHLEVSPPAPAGIDLFAPLPGSFVLAEAADSSRSSRSVQPVRSQDTEALWAVLELPLSRQDLDGFLREGGIGEYARVSPQSTGGPLRLPTPRAVTRPGGGAERLLGLNLCVAVVRRVAKPAFGTQLQRYVNLVGLSVARFAPGNALAFRFVVLDSPAPLALSLPGGFVLLTTGLLQALDNEAQLALVLAHESAHASLGHAWARAKATPFFRSGGTMTDQGVQSPLFAQMLDELLEQALRQEVQHTEGQQRGGRRQEVLRQEIQRQEFEADAAAIQMAYRAGYDPLQLAAAIRNVERAAGQPGTGPKWSDLHPPLHKRIERIQALLARLPMQDGLALGTGRFHANR
ncbi:MAG: M48 family metalloprotease [Humidesulfovibrio sp.]